MRVHERVRVGERGVGVVGTAEEGAIVPPQRLEERAPQLVAPRLVRARAPLDVRAREPLPLGIRPVRRAVNLERRVLEPREPRVRGAVVVARERRRRAAQVHQLQREHKIVGQCRPVRQPAWRPAILRVEESDYRQRLRAVLCQRGGERQLQKQLASDEIATSDERVVYRSKRRAGQQLHAHHAECRKAESENYSTGTGAV